MKNLLVALMLVGLSVPAFADQSGPCHSDAALLCPGRTWGNGLGKCLSKYSSKLSPACTASLKKNQKAFSEYKETCGNDIKKFCSDVQPGKGRVFACLNAHETDLSTSCKDELSARKG